MFFTQMKKRMYEVLLKLNGLLLLFALLCSCRNECRDISCAESVGVSFKITNYEEKVIVDSLIKVTVGSRGYSPRITPWNEIDFKVEVSNSGEFSIFYNDTLKTTVNVAVTKTKGECCDGFKIERVVVNGELKCSDNCKNEIFEMEL